ncbi:DUF1120 domain-containing protein, partial [Serratia marcescens]|uniref:DUF1120 domain-containing protein n=1 Tax=Serratia marcescens TaxID=615 RepID=UPI0024A71513
ALAGGGTIDYGIIPPASLNKDTFTVLDEKQVDFSITCDAPAKVGVHAIGSKADTSTDSSGASSGYRVFKGTLFGGLSHANVDGLGKTDEGKNIGGYGIRLDPSAFTVDGNKADLIARSELVDGWKPALKMDRGSFYKVDNKETYALSWAKPGTLEPIALKTVAGKLGVQAYIT